MRRLVIPVLASLLLASNAAWAYALFDQAVTLSYREHVLYEFAHALRATTALADDLVRGQSREAATKLLERTQPGPASDFFEKEGVLNAGWIGLELDAAGKVVRVVPHDLIDEWAKADEAPATPR